MKPDCSLATIIIIDWYKNYKQVLDVILSGLLSQSFGNKRHKRCSSNCSMTQIFLNLNLEDTK